PIPRSNRVHRRSRLQAFRNDLRLDLVRPPLLTIGPYLHPVVPEKLHRSRHRETPPLISVRYGIAGQAETGKVRPRKRLLLIGVSELTFYRWRKQYGGMSRDQLQQLKDLQKENERLRKAVADLTLDKLILTEAARGNF